MGRVLRFYNPLVYPGGRLPGFDPSHPAAAGIEPQHGLSCVVNNGGMVNLLSGQVGANANSPTFAINGLIGPTVKYPSGTGALTQFSGQSTANDTNATLAAIVLTPPSLVDGDIITTSGANNGLALHTLAAGGGRLQFTCLGVNGTFSNFVVAGSTPFFLAASWNGSIVNFLALNLATGTVLSESDAAAFSPIAPNGNYNVGDGGGGGFGGNVAAAMFTPSYMSIPAMLAWAADLWAFWYPPTQQNIMFSGLTVPPSVGAIPRTMSLRFI